MPGVPPPELEVPPLFAVEAPEGEAGPLLAELAASQHSVPKHRKRITQAIRLVRLFTFAPRLWNENTGVAPDYRL